MEEKKQHKQLGFIDCLGIGIGQIIGSGVMVLTGVVVGLTGHGTPLAFICAALLVICTMSSAVVLSSAVPSNGGGYSYVKRLIGPRAGFIYLGMFVLTQVLIATFALGFASYFAALVPGVNQKLIAMLILIAATVVNLIGIKTAASVQNVMVACLLLSLLLSPVFLAIPSFATAPALIIVGFYMVNQVGLIDFTDYAEGIPAFICIAAMPFFYSISEGISMGVISYVVLNLVSGKAKEKKISPVMYVLAVMFLLKYVLI